MVEAAIALLEVAEGQEAGVKVHDVRTTSTQAIPDKSEMAELVVATTGGGGFIKTTNTVREGSDTPSACTKQAQASSLAMALVVCY